MKSSDEHHHNNVITLLKIKVTPKAKQQQLKKIINADGSILYKIYVVDVAEDGKANKAVITLLAREFGVAKSKVTIVKGLNCRDKIIKITP